MIPRQLKPRPDDCGNLLANPLGQTRATDGSSKTDLNGQRSQVDQIADISAVQMASRNKDVRPRRTTLDKGFSYK